MIPQDHVELVRQGRKNLTVIANDSARPLIGTGKLIVAKLVRKLVAGGDRARRDRAVGFSARGVPRICGR